MFLNTNFLYSTINKGFVRIISLFQINSTLWICDPKNHVLLSEENWNSKVKDAYSIHLICGVLFVFLGDTNLPPGALIYICRPDKNM